MMRTCRNRSILASAFLILFLCSFCLFAPVDKLSMKLVSKSLQNGKSITTQAEVFYRTAGGLLVTHIIAPVEYIIVTNDKGEFKMYDLKANTISQRQGADLSSENSFIHDFLKGATSDMGLRKMGFQLKSTRIEEKLVVTDWGPAPENTSQIERVELVHEHYTPIYMAFFGKKGRLLSKVFYYNYQKAGDLNIPLTITEFQYHPNGDSTITKKEYSDVQINGAVDEKWLNYKIPANAKIIK